MTNTKTVNKRIRSTKKYFDVLQDRYSKLNIIRLDLFYNKKYSKEITLDEANKHINKMQNNKRNNRLFDNQVGYVCKREHGDEKGVHMHLIIVFNGQKVSKDILKAKKIGEYWSKEITDGKGGYYNCNMNDYEESGIGMIDHRDSEKRKILDEVVIPYLCKEDQSLEALKNSKKDRTFTRGTVSKEKTKRGRKRKEEE